MFGIRTCMIWDMVEIPDIFLKNENFFVQHGDNFEN